MIVQVSVALMVSAYACTQVVQGSIPAEDWKVIRDATAFSAVAFKMILEGTREGAHALLHKNLHLLDASRYYSYFLNKLLAINFTF